jgi:multidrug resistance efflux pump
MFVRKYVVPVLAMAGLGMAVYTVQTENKPTQPAAPVVPPATSPYAQPVAGAGIVEASTQNIAVGAHVPGVVAEVRVKVGDQVKKGDALFVVDERSVRAELEMRRAALAAAEAQVAKLAALPRLEEIPPAAARVSEAKAALEDARSQLAKMEAVTDKRAISEEEWTRRKNQVAGAEARLAEADAAMALLKAGAWKPDMAIARANVDSAKAQLAATQTELERHTVRASVDGEVLQVNIRVGEFAQAGPLSTPLMLIGETGTLHVRVDVDENDAWRVKGGAKAHAYVRGNRDLSTDVSFVRIEPYVIPKRSLTGDSVERVDTRVLQVLYSFPKGALPVYVGQQMDVFIDGVTPAGGGEGAGAARRTKEGQ